MKHEINQDKVVAVQRMHDACMEAVSNGSVRYRATHTTPDGTKWDLVLEPQDQHPNGCWSYLGIASKVKNLEFYMHYNFDTDRVYWDNLQPEDMFNLMKWDLDEEWE